MNFEEYAQQMYNKYKVALSIAVVKNKPDNLNVEQYLEKLKAKAETETIEDPTIILTDDFNFDDDDFDFDENDDPSILNDVNSSINTKEPFSVANKCNANNTDTTDNETITNEAHKHVSANLLDSFATANEEVNRHNEEVMKNVEIKHGNVNLLDKFATINGEVDRHNEDVMKDVEIKHVNVNLLDKFATINGEVDRNNEEVMKDVEITIISNVSVNDDSLEQVLNELRNIDRDEACHQVNIYSHAQEVSQIIQCDSFNYFSVENVGRNSPVCDELLEKNSGFIDFVPKINTQGVVDENLRAKVEKNISKRMNLNATEKKASRNESDFDEDISKNNYEMEVDIAINEIRQSKEQKSKLTASQTISRKPNIEISKNKKEQLEDTKVITNVTELQNVPATNTVESLTQDTIPYTLPDFTQNTSYISQSQHQNFEISQTFIHGNSKSHEINENGQNIIDNPSILTINSNAIEYIIDQSGKTYAIINSTHLDRAKENFKVDGNEESNAVSQTTSTAVSQESSIEKCKSETSQKEIEESQLTDKEDVMDKDVTPEELVPFKVIKELSKIKTYLSRGDQWGTDGNSSDSGYRSDSQSSLKGARGSWVCQAAQCLLEHVARAPLLTPTTHVLEEMAQALGALTDALHCAARHPPYMESMLRAVDVLLRQLCERDTTPRALSDKDEIVHRLILLNKSHHILEYSIGKTTSILEKMHTAFTANDNLIELTNIDKVENSMYIFNVLEIFIQMYDKNKDTTSQTSTQTSQESLLIKKNSLTDIWRKKWNPNPKEAKIAGSQAAKHCVLTKCGEVLNKIVVDCMEGYSLLSFAALQCFNMLQS